MFPVPQMHSAMLVMQAFLPNTLKTQELQRDFWKTGSREVNEQEEWLWKPVFAGLSHFYIYSYLFLFLKRMG